jgi:hypothetical protein
MEVYGDDGCWLEPHRRCTKVRGGQRCRNRSWWPGGRCHLHHNKAWTFGDWLAGVAAGRRAEQMPAHIIVCAAPVRRPDTTGNTVSDYWSRCVVQSIATYLDSPKVLAAGRKIHWSTQIQSKTVVVALPADDALVQLDQALACGRLTEAERVDQLLIEHVHRAALDCSLMDEAIRVGVSVATVVNRRLAAGER